LTKARCVSGLFVFSELANKSVSLAEQREPSPVQALAGYGE
jgi:hypothetical protein